MLFPWRSDSKVTLPRAGEGRTLFVTKRRGGKNRPASNWGHIQPVSEHVADNLEADFFAEVVLSWQRLQNGR